MAITRTQIAKQLLAQGGRIGLQGGGRDAAQADFSSPPGQDTSGDTSREDRRGGQYTSPEARTTNRERGRDQSLLEAQRRADLRKAVELFEEEKEEEKLERFRKLNDPKRRIEKFASRFSPIAMFTSKFGPLNTRDFFVENFLTSRNAPITPGQFANLTEEEKETMFDDYVSARNRGEIDAYGNQIDRDNRGGGINQIIPVDTTFAQAPSITKQEPEEEELEGLRLAFRAEGGPIGGEYDFESARQMYGLGKLVKKVTRTVKKIAKSPVGKAAITAASLYYMPKFGIKAQGGLAPFLQSAKTGIGNFFLGIPGDTGGRVAGTGLLSKFPGGGVGALIAGTSIAAGLLTAKQEEEAQALAAEEGIDIEAARNSILARAQGNTRDDFRARGFRAEGGIMRAGYQEGSKEPVAKKTMPLLDLDGKEMDLREEGGFVPIGRMEKADDVPARLSKNEFVFTADAVRNAGEGDVDKGAEVMYNMMKNLEAGGEVSEESQGLEGARKMFQTSQRLEEVL